MSPKGVNKSLDNLTSTAINQSLLPEATGTLDLGSAAFRWRDTYTNSVRYSDATIQTTALPYTAGAGISIAGNIISNTGLIAETDPQVGLNTTNYVPKWDGSALVTGSILTMEESVLELPVRLTKFRLKTVQTQGVYTW